MRSGCGGRIRTERIMECIPSLRVIRCIRFTRGVEVFIVLHCMILWHCFGKAACGVSIMYLGHCGRLLDCLNSCRGVV